MPRPTTGRASRIVQPAAPRLTTIGARVCSRMTCKRDSQIGRAAGDQDLFFGADDQIAQRQQRCNAVVTSRRCNEARSSFAARPSAPRAQGDSRCRGSCACRWPAPSEMPVRPRRASVPSTNACRSPPARGSKQCTARRSRRLRDPCRRSSRGRKCAGSAPWPSMPRTTRPVSRCGSVATCLTSTPSRAQRFAHEAPHVLVADAAQHRGAQAEAGEAGGEIRGRAAEILGEALHVFEPAADLLTVQIDCGAAEADESNARLVTSSIRRCRRSRAATRRALRAASSRRARR